MTDSLAVRIEYKNRYSPGVSLWLATQERSIMAVWIGWKGCGRCVINPFIPMFRTQWELCVAAYRDAFPNVSVTATAERPSYSERARASRLTKCRCALYDF